MVGQTCVTSVASLQWKKEQWEVAGEAETQPKCRTYVHLDSPASGSHWMKLTNNTSPYTHLLFKCSLSLLSLSPPDHPALHAPLLPQVPRHPAVRWGPFRTSSFPETTFTVVTTYQNPEVKTGSAASHFHSDQTPTDGCCCLSCL